ncbi:hypothetical protein QYM36_007017, partial [Artemia franciscana]
MGELGRAQGRAHPHKSALAGIPLGAGLLKVDPSIDWGPGPLHSQQQQHQECKITRNGTSKSTIAASYGQM